MVEIINGVKNLKQLNIGKGLTSSPIIFFFYLENVH